MKQLSKPISTACQLFITDYSYLGAISCSPHSLFFVFRRGGLPPRRNTKNELKQMLRSGLGKGKISILRNVFPNYKYFDKLKQMK